MNECYCETCGKGYDVAQSTAHSVPDFCSKDCEEAWYQARLLSGDGKETT